MTATTPTKRLTKGLDALDAAELAILRLRDTASAAYKWDIYNHAAVAIRDLRPRAEPLQFNCPNCAKGFLVYDLPLVDHQCGDCKVVFSVKG